MPTTLLLIGSLCLVLVVLAYYLALRFSARRQRKAAYLMKSPVFSKITKEMGAKPNLKSLLSTVEGRALVDTLTFCEDCKTVEKCRLFFSEKPVGPGDSTDFCPNEGLFTLLAEKLRKNGTLP